VKKAKVAIVVALAATLGVAACSTPSKTGKTGASSGPGINQQHQVEDATAHGPAAEIPGAHHGGTLTVLSQSTPADFDPASIYYTDTNEIAKLIYRTPTQYAIRDGQPVLVPDLTDLGTVSPDGLTWTFKMQQGIKYQDGSPVQIADLQYAIDRSFATDIHPDGATYQQQYFLDGDTYKGPYGAGNPTCACVTTEGTDTLIIHLKTKFNDLPFYMTFPLFAPVPAAHDTDPANYYKAPWATGPYQQQSYNPGVEMILTKNPYWDPKTDAVRHQYPDEWDFKWGGDDVKSQQAIINGATPTDQSSIDYGNIDSSLVPQVQGAKASQLITGDAPCTSVVNLDSRKIPLDVRKAIAIAYPDDQIYKASGATPLTDEPASTILPPSVPGYTSYPPLPGLSGKGPGDPATAKTMLEAWEKANNKTGFTLIWYYDNTKPIAQQVNDIRTKAMQDAGFTVQAIGVATADYRKAISDPKTTANMLTGPGGWCSDWPTGGSWFPVLFESHSITDGLSWGFQADPTLDNQIDSIAALPADQATAKWGQLDQQLMAQYLVIPREYTKLAVVQGTNIGGTVADGTVGMPFFPNMYVKS
jgi:peptide/nickel transport system substrate-binding protein